MEGSSFEVYAVDASHSFVEARIHVDPRGALPDWIVNLTSKNWPLETFRRLRQAVKEAKGFEALEAQLRLTHPGFDGTAPSTAQSSADPRPERSGEGADSPESAQNLRETDL